MLNSEYLVFLTKTFAWLYYTQGSQSVRGFSPVGEDICVVYMKNYEYFKGIMEKHFLNPLLLDVVQLSYSTIEFTLIQHQQF
jgi:hypothetical protein